MVKRLNFTVQQMKEEHLEVYEENEVLHEEYAKLKAELDLMKKLKEKKKARKELKKKPIIQELVSEESTKEGLTFDFDFGLPEEFTECKDEKAPEGNPNSFSWKKLFVVMVADGMLNLVCRRKKPKLV